VLTHHFGRRLAERGRGGVLLGSALGADSGIPFHAKEAASKAMVSTLGRSLHAEFAQLGLNLTVLVVTPTSTPIIDKMGLGLRDMPLKPMPVEKCVREALQALSANRMMVVPGRFYRIMNALMPHALARWMTANMMQKSKTFVS
jgi:short-subunit dehydrogenase